jgi:hypothetical protein
VHDFKEFRKIKISNLHNKNRTSLLKILHLYEYINDTNIFDDMIKNILKIEDTRKIKIIKMRIESIMEDLQLDSYENKIETNDFIEYIYKNKKIYFIKDNKNVDTIESIIKNEKNIQLYNKKGKINVNIKNIDKIRENIDNINKIVVKYKNE